MKHAILAFLALVFASTAWGQLPPPPPSVPGKCVGGPCGGGGGGARSGPSEHEESQRIARHNRFLDRASKLSKRGFNQKTVADWLAFARESGWVMGYFNYATAQQNMGNLDEAIHVYGQLATIDPCYFSNDGYGSPSNDCAEAGKRAQQLRDVLVQRQAAEQAQAGEEREEREQQAQRDADDKEWKWLLASQDSPEVLGSWLSFARSSGWQSAWYNYAAMASRLGDNQEAIDGYKHMLSMGCPAKTTAEADLCPSATQRIESLQAKMAEAAEAAKRKPEASSPCLGCVTVVPSTEQASELPGIHVSPVHVEGKPPGAGVDPKVEEAKARLAADQNTLKGLQDAQSGLLAKKAEIDEEEANINRLVDDQHRQIAEYEKIRAKYEMDKTEAGRKQVQELYGMLKAQEKRITDYTLAWAAEKKANNAALNENSAQIEAANKKMEEDRQ